MITVTGASGHLGRLVVEDLLAHGVPAAELAVVVRSPEKVSDLAARGVQVRAADYGDLPALTAALAGTDRLLLVSSSEVGNRIAQHRNVIEAAKAAGVALIAYTSILRADTSQMALAAEHLATEQAIRESGLAFTLLRNGWYLENYTENLGPALQFGTIFGSAGEGRIAAAARADYAAAAAAVLTGTGVENTVLELGGDRSFTMAEVAAAVTAAAGKPVSYTDLPAQEYTKVLVSAGLPEPFAQILADSDLGVARGDLDTDSDDLHRLIGRPTTSLTDAVAAALAG